MANVFISKSARLSKKETIRMSPSQEVFVDKSVYVANLVMWVGQDVLKLFKHGKAFGFNCIWFGDNDLSFLIHAKCLIFSFADMFGKTLSAVNFACEYGIPTLWLNKCMPPSVCFWSFDIKFGEQDPKAFWESICHLV